MTAQPSPQTAFPAPMTDAEREAHIVDCGLLMQKAYAEGDHVGARRWLELQAEAIRARTPAQVARMEANHFTAHGGQRRAAGG